MNNHLWTMSSDEPAGQNGSATGAATICNVVDVVVLVSALLAQIVVFVATLIVIGQAVKR